MAGKTKVIDSSRMGREPEGSLLIKMAVPMMLSMMVQALYNVVDSVYVSRVSEHCLTALSLAFPIQNILIGIGTGTGVGVAALVSRALGAKDSARAKRISGISMFLVVCGGILMALFGIFGARPFIYAQTSDPVIGEYAVQYLQVVTIGAVCVYFEIMFERLLQSTGLTQLSMWTQLIGAITNIILDPFFIYGWAGLPAMGTRGAAVATVAGQFLAAGAGFFFHLKRNHELRFSVADMMPDWGIVAAIYKIGFPSIVMMCINSLTNFIMNNILISFTSTAVAVYGAFFKIQSFFFMPVMGLNNAMVPIIGYNYGALKKERIYKTRRFGILYATVIMTAGFIAMEFFPDKLLLMFSPSQEMLDIGTKALRRIALHFPFAGFCIVSGSTLQALNKGLLSLLTASIRSLVAIIPAAYLLSLTGNVDNVWFCFIIAEGFSVLANVLCVRKAFNDMEKDIAARQAAAAERAAAI